MRDCLHYKSLFVIAIITLSLFLFTTCITHTSEAIVVNNYGDTFAGVASCQKCHAEVYDDFTKTGHYHTSAPGDKEYIKGSFESGKNVLSYSYFDNVVMEDRDSGLYQTLYYKSTEKRSERIDLVIGSGTRGQTYLYWKDHSFYQLPVSYFTPTQSWSNSAGNGQNISYNRTVYARCMECHSTYIKAIGNSVQNFDRTKMVYGVTCESCHGAAQKHAAFHLAHPDEKKAMYIINPALLSRQQQLDQCALCHSGTKESIKPAFSFIPGDTLANYYIERTKLDSATNQDVHGNKYNLFVSSQCFRNSPGMTCATCHNTHVNERGNVALFSKKCAGCHNEANHNFCKLAPTVGEVIKEDCIDCHMPKRPSSVLSVYVPEKNESIAAQIREHRIAVYPEETDKVLAYLKGLKKH